ncbi:MAG: hypothetical protein H6Q89_2756, partial [Myxococcaceae bacterium]|nr:hypothetical protein [Myxococcaceae bacterium]
MAGGAAIERSPVEVAGVERHPCLVGRAPL